MPQAKLNDERDLSAEDVRLLLYDIGSDAHLGCTALDALDDQDKGEAELTIIALRKLFARIQSRAEDAAGGPTFDRLDKLESGRLP